MSNPVLLQLLLGRLPWVGRNPGHCGFLRLVLLDVDLLLASDRKIRRDAGVPLRIVESGNSLRTTMATGLARVPLPNNWLGRLNVV